MILNNFYQYLLKSTVPPENYVLFSGPTQFTLNGVNSSRNSQITWDGETLYSTDGKKYNSWDKSEITAQLDSTDNLYKIYLQGKNNTYFKATNWYGMKMTGSGVSLSGYLEALLDAESVSNGGHPTMANSAFQCAFRELPVISAEDLIMPIRDNYPVSSFYGTFCDMPDLVYPPKILPALKIQSDAYQELFMNNVSMIKSPIILAETEGSSKSRILYKMFYGCSALVEPPAIKLGTSSTGSFQGNQFGGCSSLIRLPRITKPGNWSEAFKGCSNIKISETQDATYQYSFTIPSSGTYTDMFSNTGGTFTGTPVAGTTYYTDHPLVEPYFPVEFVSNNSFTIAATEQLWEGALEYSTDKLTWSTWDGTTITAASDGNKYRLCFRGTGNTKITGVADKPWVITGSGVEISGQIESLLDYTTAANSVTVASSAYNSLFKGQTAITRVKNLIISNTTGSAYKDMFNGCTNLIDTPNFYVYKNGGFNNYESMFKGCTALTETNDMTGTYAYYSSHQSMFEGCTSLIASPKLPIISDSLAFNCFKSMFNGCTSLTKIPLVLPATTMTSACYYGMFSGCTSLTKPPKLPATTLNGSCYREMFKGCTSLTTAPELPATTMTSSCYQQMFYGCTSLTTAPKLPAETLYSDCYREMFYGCTSLTAAPELPATTLADNCYREMFKDCTSLTLVPTLPATTGAGEAYNSMFAGCTSLVTAPKIEMINAASANFSCTFSGCTNLEVIPDLSNVTGSANFIWYETFKNCSKVKVYTDPSKGEPLLTGIGESYGSTFGGTSGDYTGSAQNGVTYYTSNQLV